MLELPGPAPPIPFVKRLVKSRTIAHAQKVKQFKRWSLAMSRDTPGGETSPRDPASTVRLGKPGNAKGYPGEISPRPRLDVAIQEDCDL